MDQQSSRNLQAALLQAKLRRNSARGLVAEPLLSAASATASVKTDGLNSTAGNGAILPVSNTPQLPARMPVGGQNETKTPSSTAPGLTVRTRRNFAPAADRFMLALPASPVELKDTRYGLLRVDTSDFRGLDKGPKFVKVSSPFLNNQASINNHRHGHKTGLMKLFNALLHPGRARARSAGAVPKGSSGGDEPPLARLAALPKPPEGGTASNKPVITTGNPIGFATSGCGFVQPASFPTQLLRGRGTAQQQHQPLQSKRQVDPLSVDSGRTESIRQLSTLLNRTATVPSLTIAMQPVGSNRDSDHEGDGSSSSSNNDTVGSLSSVKIYSSISKNTFVAAAAAVNEASRRDLLLQAIKKRTSSSMRLKDVVSGGGAATLSSSSAILPPPFAAPLAPSSDVTALRAQVAELQAMVNESFGMISSLLKDNGDLKAKVALLEREG